MSNVEKPPNSPPTADATHSNPTTPERQVLQATAMVTPPQQVQSNRLHQTPVKTDGDSSTEPSPTSTLVVTPEQIFGDDGEEYKISLLKVHETHNALHDIIEDDSTSVASAHESDSGGGYDSDASVDLDDDKRENRYFTGYSTKSEDFLFDIHAKGDPLEIYPIDVQTYIRLMGFKSGFREQFQEGDETLARAEIAAGLKILREAQANKSGLFFSPDHQFSPEAFKTIPLYPWLYGIPKFILRKISSDTEEWDYNDDNAGQYNEWKVSMFKGNVRLPLPPYLFLSCIPGVGSRWEQIIAYLYGYQSPIDARRVLWGCQGRDIVRLVREGIAMSGLCPRPKAPKGSRVLMGSWDYYSDEELYGVMPDEPMMSDEQLRAMFRSSYFE